MKFTFVPYLYDSDTTGRKNHRENLDPPRDAYEEIANTFRKIWSRYYLEDVGFESASIEILDDKFMVTCISNESFDYELSVYNLLSEPLDGFNFDMELATYQGIEYKVGADNDTLKILPWEYLSTKWCDED